MIRELLKSTLPFYLGLNIVLLALVLVTFPFVRRGSGSFVIATVTAAFVAIQIVGAVALLRYLSDESAVA